MEKKGVSGVITTILLMLLVLAAIVIVWNVVQRVVKTGSEGIRTEVFTINLEIQGVKLWVTGGAKVTVERGAGEGEIDELRFIFEEQNGITKVIAREKEKGYEMPKKLETKVYDFSAEEINEKIEKVSLAPVFENNVGIKVSEPESEIKKENGERIPDAPGPEEIQNIGFVSWWKFDETSGNMVADSISNNNGNISGAIFVNDAERGKVASFDGVDDFVNITHNPNLNPGTESFTITAWIKPNTISFSGSQRFIWKNDGGGLIFNGYYFMLWNGPSVVFGVGNGTNEAQPIGGNVTAGKWYFVAGVRDKVSGSAKLYLDAILNKSIVNNTGDINYNGNLIIGGRESLSDMFNGSIDDIMIFNKSLSQKNIEAIYNNLK